MNKLSKLTVTCVVGLIMALAPVGAGASLLYGHGSDYDVLSGSDSSLYRIDTVTQTVTLVGSNIEERVGPETQFNPSGSISYMSQAGWDGSNIFLIDPTSGLTTSTLNLSGFPAVGQGSPDITDTATALEFVGSTLYGSFHQNGPESRDGILGTINTTTGAITTIGQMTGMNRPTGGLSFVNGTMYAVSATDNKDSRLFTVDLTTGAATLINNLTLNGVQQEAATALAFSDGTMYTLLTNWQDTNLYSINLQTGALTLEFDLGIKMNSLTTPVPVPAAIWLLGSGLAGLAGTRLRRKK